MNEVERYIQNVLSSIHASPQERARVEADLRSHFQEALAAGESATRIIGRMGDATQVAEAFMADVTLRYAGFWARLGAFFIDVALCAAAASPMAFLGVLLSNVVPQAPIGWDYAIGGVVIAMAVSLWLGAASVFLLYFPILEGRFGQTIGKRSLGLRVLNENGLPIGFKGAFLRRLPFYFDFLPVDALFVFFTAKRQRAFDIIARTVVVHDRPSR